MKIKELSRRKLNDALSLVWDVFLEYEAVNYSESGKQAFWDSVHSSLFAVSIYKKLGFAQTNDVQEDGGIQYVPMKYQIKDNNKAYAFSREIGAKEIPKKKK